MHEKLAWKWPATRTKKVAAGVKVRLLIDLGFYKHQIFARIEENGGYFVSRLKNNADLLTNRWSESQVVEAPLWIGILTLIVSRRVYLLVYSLNLEDTPRYTHLR